MNAELTKPQARVLRFIEQLAETNSPPPTCREICAHCGYRSPKAASDILAILEEKSCITRDPKCARGIRLLRQGGIPLVGSIVAGMPSIGTAAPGGRLAIDPAIFGIADRSRAFALRVRGDSMERRHIFDGDIVLLESDATPRHESIVAALIDHESNLKTLLIRKGKAWLRAENPRYPDLIPAWDLQIQGVARAVIRHLPK